jgi:hypothetical protein
MQLRFMLALGASVDSWSHTHHIDRRLGVPWRHVEFAKKDAGIWIELFGVGEGLKVA